MRDRASGVAWLSLVLLGGCASHGMHVNAVVTSAPAGGQPARPLAGALVSMACPQIIKSDEPSPLERTDARGEVHYSETPLGRWIHDGCELVVEAPGHQPRRFRVAEVCREYRANHCVQAVLAAELMPAQAVP